MIELPVIFKFNVADVIENQRDRKRRRKMLPYKWTDKIEDEYPCDECEMYKEYTHTRLKKSKNTQEREWIERGWDREQIKQDLLHV